MFIYSGDGLDTHDGMQSSIDGTILIPGQRYWFVVEETRAFRANFVDIIGDNTLRVIQHEQDLDRMRLHASCVWTLPLEWITRVATVDTVTRGRLPLPADVVRAVDNYV